MLCVWRNGSLFRSVHSQHTLAFEVLVLSISSLRIETCVIRTHPRQVCRSVRSSRSGEWRDGISRFLRVLASYTSASISYQDQSWRTEGKDYPEFVVADTHRRFFTFEVDIALYISLIQEQRGKRTQAEGVKLWLPIYAHPPISGLSSSPSALRFLLFPFDTSRPSGLSCFSKIATRT